MSEIPKATQNEWFVLLSRMMTILMVPYLSWMGLTLLDVKDRTTQLNSAVLLAIEPRVEVLEGDLRNLRTEVNNRTTSRFTREDGDKLKVELRRDISRIEGQLAALKNVIK